MLYPGDRVKDYEVIAPLRSGGMAMLYLARRRGVGGFSRLVALKLVHPHLLRDASITKLFLEEARISAHVAHPNVVSVEEIGPTGSSYFIAMEYVHGVSLSELLTALREKRLRMSPKLCVWLTAQIAEALHAVHETTGENGVPLQIVHRDVSPQNVLVGHTGHVKLIDFGIAKSCSRGYQTAGTGPAVLGKLGYMAPEQLRSEPADRRSDAYALGVMLWEMLAARSLFLCKSLDDEHDWRARENPPAPGKFTTFSTPALDRVVVKALAFSREQRYATALEFRAALLAAEPSASQVDAPMFAALMRTMLGSKLEQLRAKLPSEVSQALARDAEATTARARSVEGLTAHIGSSDDAGNSNERIEPLEDDSADEPTSIAASATEVSRSEMLPVTGGGVSIEGGSAAEPETGPTMLYSYEGVRVPTEPAKTYLVESPRPVMRPGQVWMLRAAVGMVCLAVGIAAGALVSGFGPRSMPAHASSAARSVAQQQAASARAAPSLKPTPAAEREELKPAAATPALPPAPEPPSAHAAPTRTQRPVASPLERNKRGAGAKVPTGAKTASGTKTASGAKAGGLRAAKFSKGSAVGGRKTKSPLTRKIKNAVR
jgi:serine/threonine protein kinase